MRGGQCARALSPSSERAPELLHGLGLQEKLEGSEYTARPGRRLAWLVERSLEENDFASREADWLLCVVNPAQQKLSTHTAVQEFNSPRNEEDSSSLLTRSGSFRWPLCPFR